MSTQRMIEFEATTEESAGKIADALAEAFGALAAARPTGVRLAYWRARDTRRFVALIDLTDEGSNPLLDVEAARDLPDVIAGHVEGGYPRPRVVDLLGSYGFGPSLDPW